MCRFSGKKGVANKRTESDRNRTLASVGFLGGRLARRWTPLGISGVHHWNHSGVPWGPFGTLALPLGSMWVPPGMFVCVHLFWGWCVCMIVGSCFCMSRHSQVTALSPRELARSPITDREWAARWREDRRQMDNTTHTHTNE